MGKTIVKRLFTMDNVEIVVSPFVLSSIRDVEGKAERDDGILRRNLIIHGLSDPRQIVSPWCLAFPFSLEL